MKILIVDDMEVNLELLEARLEGSGYEVTSAKNGIEALERLKTDSIDMIISDVLMPKMDGFQLCRECKSDETLRNIPFVFYTATYTDKKDEEFGLSLGAERFLVKQMENKPFMEAIKQILKNHKKGLLTPHETLVEKDESVYLKEYNERLINKLENKMIDLEKEITERKRAEERIKHLNKVILAVRNVNQLITKEKDRDKLIKGSCDILIESREYYNAWILLLEETGELVTTAEAGLGKEFLPMLERLERGELPDCARQALSQSEVVVIGDPPSTCADCPLSVSYGGRGGLVVRLEHAKKVYGLLILSVPRDSTTDDEEQGFIKEVAEDIALALHSIELEKEQKKAEKEIRQAGEEWMLTFDSITDWVSIQDKDFKIVRANRAYANNFDMKPDELTGKPCYEVVHGTKEPYPKCPHRQTLETKKPATEEFFEPHLGIYLEMTTSPIFNENGEVTGTVHITKDITEHRKLEAQFRQAQKMEAIGTLAGGIAHDFNNLLTAIIGFGELGLVRISKEDSLRENFEEIVKAGKQAGSLTKQLLAFSRKQAFDLTILNLNDSLGDMENMLQRMIGEDIILETVLSPELSQIKADPTQMQQVIMNIAVNSRDAMPQGGKLTIETSNTYLDEQYSREHDISLEPGHYVMMALTDTGFGMDKETQGRIFEPFFTTKETGQGTGLGMATVYGIIKQSDGYIWVYSEPGQGTTFKIYFPSVTGKATTVKKDYTVIQDFSGSETILIVEDEEGVRKLATKTLRSYGYKVLEAKDGQEALSSLERYGDEIHLLLTDVVMPGMSGRDLASRLNTLKPGIKVLFMSGYTGTTLVHHGVLEQGINFIEKPYSPVDLARKVHEVLDSD